MFSIGKYHDLTGEKFGRLTVVSDAGRDKYGNVLWKCICECGNLKIIKGYNLVTGSSKSCGCLRIENTIKANTIHGMKDTRLYRIWAGMLTRCKNKNHKDYKYYGKRGIKVCSSWLEFKPFAEWALKNGYKNKLTIDRKNVNGNYEPSNCRWITFKEQMNNTRRNIKNQEMV